MTPCGPSLEVLATGPLALVQDLGRPGLAAVGRRPVGRGRPGLVPPRRTGCSAQDDSAAAHRGDLRRPGGPGARHGHAGAHRRAGTRRGRARPGGPPRPRRAARGDVLRLGVPPAGLRSYLTVRGGIDVPAVLGLAVHRRALRARPGRRCAAGDVLPVGPAPAALPVRGRRPAAAADRRAVAVRAARVRAPTGSRTRRCWRRRPGRCPAAATGSASGWRARRCVTTRPGGTRSCPARASSRGAIQVPPGGEPVLFLADHPVTGGYPVAASCGTPTSTGWPRRCPDSPSASRSPPRPDRVPAAGGHSPA